MRIRSVSHKGLRRFIERNGAAGLPSASVEKIRNMLSFLHSMGSTDELKALQSWSAHQLTGDRKGVWSLTVTRNFRMTFWIEEDEIVDLNLEDYH